MRCSADPDIGPERIPIQRQDHRRASVRRRSPILGYHGRSVGACSRSKHGCAFDGQWVVFIRCHRPGPVRLSGRILLVLGALLGLIIIAASDQVVPATTPYGAQMRLWLAARATGLTSYVLLTVLVSLGLVLSHPVNQSTWKLSKRLFPWHENLLVFAVAFLGAHVVSLILDPYAGVGIGGALIPGLSSYRTVPVALGTLALYALLVTGLTARYTKLLPPGWWLKLHRFSLVVWGLAWVHGIVAGTDTDSFAVIYVASGLIVLAAAAYRYWVAKQRRPTFATSLRGRTRADAPASSAARDGGATPTALSDAPFVQAKEETSR
jgi:sulfoxide reductase heme-binding subunit YedZ